MPKPPKKTGFSYDLTPMINSAENTDREHSRCPECTGRKAAVVIMHPMNPKQHPATKPCSCGWEPSVVIAGVHRERKLTPDEQRHEDQAKKIKNMPQEQFDAFWSSHCETLREAQKPKKEAPSKSPKDMTPEEFDNFWHQMKSGEVG